ncbi:hypothetical protein PLICRDRAFT_127464, partial [Plicaturopsis crispa FD-325 SS-3]
MSTQQHSPEPPFIDHGGREVLVLPELESNVISADVSDETRVFLERLKRSATLPLWQSNRTHSPYQLWDRTMREQHDLRVLKRGYKTLVQTRNPEFDHIEGNLRWRHDISWPRIWYTGTPGQIIAEGLDREWDELEEEERLEQARPFATWEDKRRHDIEQQTRKADEEVAEVEIRRSHLEEGRCEKDDCTSCPGIVMMAMILGHVHELYDERRIIEATVC